jgi:hypothetical protein
MPRIERIDAPVVTVSRKVHFQLGKEFCSEAKLVPQNPDTGGRQIQAEE